MAFAEKLKKLREAAGLNQSELAIRAKLSQTTVSALERGRNRKPSFEVVAKLARGLNVEVAALLTEAEGNSEPAPRPTPGRLALPLMPIAIPRIRSLAVAGASPIPPDEIVAYDYVGPRADADELVSVEVTGRCLNGIASPGDVAIFNRVQRARSGQLVVALFEGVTVVKYLVKREGGWWLESLHEPPLKVDGETKVFGRVIHILKEPPSYKAAMETQRLLGQRETESER